MKAEIAVQSFKASELFEHHARQWGRSVPTIITWRWHLGPLFSARIP